MYLRAGAASGLASSITVFSPSYIELYMSLFINGDSKLATEMSASLTYGATSLRVSLYE